MLLDIATLNGARAEHGETQGEGSSIHRVSNPTWEMSYIFYRHSPGRNFSYLGVWNILLRLSDSYWVYQSCIRTSFFSRYEHEAPEKDEIRHITPSEHDGGYNLNYEARQCASKLNQSVKTIKAYRQRIKACHIHKSKGLKHEPNDTGKHNQRGSFTCQ